MSSIIPDGISTADLQALAKEAPVSVTIEMNFTETRIITKDEIEEGL